MLRKFLRPTEDPKMALLVFHKNQGMFCDILWAREAACCLSGPHNAPSTTMLLQDLSMGLWHYPVTSHWSFSIIVPSACRYKALLYISPNGALHTCIHDVGEGLTFLSAPYTFQADLIFSGWLQVAKNIFSDTFGNHNAVYSSCVQIKKMAPLPLSKTYLL